MQVVQCTRAPGSQRGPRQRAEQFFVLSEINVIKSNELSLKVYLYVQRAHSIVLLAEVGMSKCVI